MFKKTGCLLPVLAVLIFFTYIAIRQGINTIFFDDWSEDYEVRNVVIAGAQQVAVDEEGYADEHGGYVIYMPIVQYAFEGKMITDTLESLLDESDVFYKGDSLEVSISKFTGKIAEDGVEGSQTGTGIVNLIMGFVFLIFAFLIIKSLRKKISARQMGKEQ